MRHLCLTVFLLTFPSFVGAETARRDNSKPASDVPALTFEAVADAVIANNPSVKEARAKWDAARQRAPQAAAWEDPKVSAGSRVARFVRIPPNSFGDQMLSIEQMIPLSGKNKSRERVALAEALMVAEEVRRKELDAVAKAHVSFFKLASLYALLDLNSGDENSLKQTVESTRAKFETGGAMQAEVLMAENELARIHEARQDLSQSLSEEETKISVLMNRDPFKPLGRPAVRAQSEQGPSISQLRALVVSTRPEVRMAVAAVSQAQAKLELAKRDRIPDPTLSVQTQRYNGASQAASEVAVGISISLPWFNGRKYQAEEKEAASSVEAAQHALDGARIEALGMLRDQLRKIETAHHHVELDRDNLLPTAAQTVEANRAGYETSKTTLMALLSSQLVLRDLQSMYQKHLAEYEAAIAELEAIVGADRQSFSPPEETTKPKGRK